VQVNGVDRAAASFTFSQVTPYWRALLSDRARNDGRNDRCAGGAPRVPPVVRGCLTGIAIGSQSTTAQLFVYVAVSTTNLVNGIAADSNDNSVGVLFC
jgi:hypothetical protein